MSIEQLGALETSTASSVEAPALPVIIAGDPEQFSDQFADSTYRTPAQMTRALRADQEGNSPLHHLFTEPIKVRSGREALLVDTQTGTSALLPEGGILIPTRAPRETKLTDQIILQRLTMARGVVAGVLGMRAGAFNDEAGNRLHQEARQAIEAIDRQLSALLDDSDQEPTQELRANRRPLQKAAKAAAATMIIAGTVFGGQNEVHAEGVGTTPHTGDTTVQVYGAEQPQRGFDADAFIQTVLGTEYVVRGSETHLNLAEGEIAPVLPVVEIPENAKDAFQAISGQRLTVAEFRVLSGDYPEIEAAINPEIANNQLLIEQYGHGNNNIRIVEQDSRLYVVPEITRQTMGEDWVLLPFEKDGAISFVVLRDTDGRGKLVTTEYKITDQGAIPVAVVWGEGTSATQAFVAYVDENGKQQYLAVPADNFTRDAEEAPEAELVLGTAHLNAGVNVRSGPSTSEAVLVQTTEPIEARIISQQEAPDGVWYQLRFSDGSLGWARWDVSSPVFFAEPRTLKTPEPPAPLSPEMEIILRYAEFGEAQIVAEKGVAFFSDGYNDEIMEGRGYVMNEEYANLAMDFLIEDLYRVTNTSLARRGLPQIQEGDPITFKTRFQGGMWESTERTKQETDREITGPVNNIRFLVVSPEEFTRIQNTFIANEGYLTPFYRTASFSTNNSNSIITGLAYFANEGDLIYISKGEPDYGEQSEKYEGTAISLTTDTFMNAYVGLLYSASYGMAAISPVNTANGFNSSLMFKQTGCYWENDFCYPEDGSPAFTPTPPLSSN